MNRTWIKKTLLTVLVFMLSLFMLAGCGNETNSEDPAPAQPEQTEATESNTNEQTTEADEETADDEPAVKPDEDFEKGANANTRFIENGNITARIQVPTIEGWRVWPADPSDPLSYATLYYNPNNEYEGDNSPKVEIRINEAGPAIARLDEVTDSGFANIGDLAFDYRKFTVANGMEAYDFIHDITDEYTVYIYVQGFDFEDPDLVDLLYSIKFKVE